MVVVVMMMSANWEEETAEGWTRRARQRVVCKTIKRVAVVVVIATPFLNPATIVTLNNASAHPRTHIHAHIHACTVRERWHCKYAAAAADVMYYVTSNRIIRAPGPLIKSFRLGKVYNRNSFRHCQRRRCQL